MDYSLRPSEEKGRYKLEVIVERRYLERVLKGEADIGFEIDLPSIKIGYIQFKIRE